MNKLKVYVADNQIMFRKGLIRLLGDFKFIHVVEEAENSNELLKMVNQEIPDIVILEIEFPIMNSISVCRKLAKHYPEIKIIILSMYDTSAHLMQL